MDLFELQDLLKQLAVGADQFVLSPDDWAHLLGENPMAHGFTKQLRQEWQPLLIPTPLCTQMMLVAQTHLSSWHTGWPHIWAHTLRVIGAACAIAPEAEIEQEEAFLLGLFHDLGKLDEMRGEGTHEQIGADLFRRHLKDHLKNRVVNDIATAIAKKVRAASTPYSRLLYDADKLDKIGATGIARRLSTQKLNSVHLVTSLRRLRNDTENFPELFYPTGSRLATLKKDFTENFLAYAEQLQAQH